jgi:outer membrane protein TolC
MKTIGLSQRLPYPGKLSLARDVAQGEVAAAGAALEDLRLEITKEVRQSYYELAFIDREMEVVVRHSKVLSALVSAAAVRYSVGTTGQEDVLQAQVETAALAAEASQLAERRRGVLAELNRLSDRPPETPMDLVLLPERLASAAVRASPRVGFVSLELGARVADSPLRPLEELLDAVVLNNPTLHEHLAQIDAQQARLDLARKASLPDFEVALSYGQRDNRPDMMSLSVALPLPVNRGARQDAWTAEAQATLAVLHAEHRDHVNGLRSNVTELYSDLERERSNLELLTAGMLPHGTAALQAATAGFGVGRTDFRTVLATQTTLFQYETGFHRALTDFAKGVAELERLVGEEVLR